MAGSAEEVRTQEEEANATQGNEDKDKDFDAGFNDEPTEETPPAASGEKAAEDKSGEQPEEGAQAKEGAEPAAADPGNEFVQLTKTEYESLKGLSTQIEQIRADAQKKIDTAFGKVGGVERALNELRNARPAGVAVEVTDDIVAELTEEFPELGKLQLGVLKKFASKLKSTGTAAAPFDPNQVAPLIDERARQLQRDILSIRHEDWEEIVGVPGEDGNVPETEFRKWLTTKPQDYREKVAGAWDARTVAKAIDTFKAEAKAAKEAAEKEAASKTADAQKTRQAGPSARQRALEAAASPRGEGGRPTGPTEEDEFEAGFKS